MKRILFVDDEPLVLDGLRDLFRRQRREWDMAFAPGGPEALAMLTDGTYDVIVSDMRMPVVDGNAVLTAAREHQPAAARVILSGYAGRDAELHALTVAHQFVSKPCDPARLRAIIERACGLPALLTSEPLRRLIGRLERLPSPPELYWALTRATRRTDVSMAELADLVEQDPAMAAKVLQMVNSAFFGPQRTYTSVHQALVFLGIQRLKALVLSAQIFEEGRAGLQADVLAAQQRHAADVAQLAQRLVSDPALGETAYTAGLLHEVGTIVFALADAGGTAAIAERCGHTGCAAVEAELEYFGTTHADAGAYLLALWGLPLDIVEGVQYHHRPAEARTDTVVAVHAADALLHEVRGTSGGPMANRLDMAFLQASPWAARLDEWRAMAAEFARH